MAVVRWGAHVPKAAAWSLAGLQAFSLVLALGSLAVKSQVQTATQFTLMTLAILAGVALLLRFMKKLIVRRCCHDRAVHFLVALKTLVGQVSSAVSSFMDILLYFQSVRIKMNWDNLTHKEPLKLFEIQLLPHGYDRMRFWFSNISGLCVSLHAYCMYVCNKGHLGIEVLIWLPVIFVVILFLVRALVFAAYVFLAIVDIMNLKSSHANAEHVSPPAKLVNLLLVDKVLCGWPLWVLAILQWEIALSDPDSSVPILAIIKTVSTAVSILTTPSKMRLVNERAATAASADSPSDSEDLQSQAEERSQSVTEIASDSPPSPDHQPVIESLEEGAAEEPSDQSPEASGDEAVVAPFWQKMYMYTICIVQLAFGVCGVLLGRSASSLWSGGAFMALNAAIFQVVASVCTLACASVQWIAAATDREEAAERILEPVHDSRGVLQMFAFALGLFHLPILFKVAPAPMGVMVSSLVCLCLIKCSACCCLFLCQKSQLEPSEAARAQAARGCETADTEVAHAGVTDDSSDFGSLGTSGNDSVASDGTVTRLSTGRAPLLRRDSAA